MKKRLYTIALIILLLFSSTMFFLTRFNKSTLIARDGFFVTGQKLDEVLLSPNKVAKTGNVSLEKVTSDDTFYTNVGKVFVGEEKKVQVNTIYPMYVNNGLGVVNLDAESKLINRKFEYFDTYENFTVTGGKLYNFGDYEQADYEDYILLELSNGTYVNLLELTIKLNEDTIDIPVNSIINFQEGYLNYYYYNKQGKLIYKILDGINLSDEINFGKFKYDYKKLLIKLGKLEDDSKQEDAEKGQENEDDYLLTDQGSGSSGGKGSAEGTNKYIAPKVTSTKFSANVYSAKTTLTIQDPSKVIVGGINYQFYVNDKVFLRKTFITGGTIEVIGLVPNTTFKIVGTYKYYNEESKKMEMTFFEQELTTLGVDNLEPISLNFNNGTVYPNKIELNNLSITSDLNSETIKGVNKAIILINDEQYSIPTGSLSEIIKGKSVTYTSPAKIDSNTSINYQIKFLDAYSNEMKVTNNTGSTRTSKNSPSATVKVTSSAVNSLELAITLKNIDEVNIKNYRYAIIQSNGKTFEEKSLDSKKEVSTVTLKNLDPNSTYSIQILGDYDNENGQGTMLNQVIGEGRFTTAPLSSLGFFRIVASPNDLTDNSVTISSQMDVINVSSILVELLNSLTATVTDEEGTIVFQKTYQGDELNSIKAGEEIQFDISDLSSVTTYNVNYVAKVKQGSVTEEINVLCSLKNFTTYKRKAEVEIQNEFVTSSMIDFDVRIVDLDGAITSGRTILEIRNSRGDLVGKEYLNINDDFVQLTYDKLEENETYTFKYYVEEYNIGFSNATYEGDYTLLTKNVVTEPGVSASIEMVDLLRDVTGENLFNIEDYDRIRKEGNTGYKEYDLKNNSVMFGAKNGYVNYSYFLPEAVGKIVLLKFSARYTSDTPNKAPVYIGRAVGQTLEFEVSNLTNEYKEYTFSFRMNSNYIGFIINETSNQNKKTTVDFKDIQIIYVEETGKNDISLSYHESGKRFTDAVMHSGEESMPDWRTTGSVVGNYGEGHARITNVANGQVTEFKYQGSPSTFTVPTTGSYKIELWGAAGGDNTTNNDQTKGSHGGRGAYTAGTISLDGGTNLYVYVGGKGAYGSGKSAYNGPVGGYNGGGNGANSGSGSGGGATDVRLTNGEWNNLDSLKSRIMVAAGGGGTDDSGGTLHGNNDGSGSAGGALTSKGAYINGVLNTQYGAGQTFGYAFGYGGDAFTNTDTGGGGGGYFGGIPSNNSAGGAGGGSSYISGYTGCIAYHHTLTSDYNEYEENDQFKGTFNIGIDDKRDEITTKDWYVRIYRKGEYVREYQYELTSNHMENIVKTYGFDKYVNYTVVVSVKIRERYYDLASVEFSTESEVRAIRTTNDFINMHTNGKYIVLNDLDFTGQNVGIGNYFYGQIDFQGHHLIRSVQNASARLFEQFRSSAVLKNVVVDFKLDNTASRNWWYGLITYNYGTIDNIMINILEATRQPNYIFTLGTYANYGVIQNFVINCKAAMSGLAGDGVMAWSNQGILRNGYIYGQNIYAYHQNIDTRSRKDIGALTGEATNNSRIESVYSLISVEKNNSFGTGEKESVVGNIVGYHGAGYFGNSYSVEMPDTTNTNIITQDPNIGKVSGIRSSELYYVSDRTYGGNYSNKVSKQALYDKTFQNQVLNKYNGFEVDSYVDLGYFPQVKLNDCMPKQDWIELPKVTEGDLLDVTSVEEIENNGNSAKVKLHINNPANEQITRVTISDISKVEILDQVNSFGKTELTVMLSEPRAYKSRYFVDTLYIKPAYGSEYTKTYNKNERAINIDLFYPIYNLNDWKTIVSVPSQNYALMDDIDFKNTSISQYVVTGTFSAKFDGRGHTIKNITLTNNNAMIYTLTGTIKNLNIENYTKTNKTSYGGFVYQANANSIIDNVHLTKARVHARDRIGGLVGYANQMTIRNSSVTDFVPLLYTDENGTALEDASYEFDNIYVGAIAGYSYLSFIENSYVQDVNIEISNVLSTLGVGGLVGRADLGTIQDSYATGDISCNSVNVGGIVGWSNATISNVWSYVNLSTELDYVGGIVGKSDNSNVSNTLVFGAVYSSYVSNQGNNVHRTVGNTIATVQSNYAWDKQKYYGLVTGESSSEVLLSTGQLEEENTYIDLLGFGAAFDLSQITEDIVPKINNSDSGELIPNQKDVKLETEMFDLLETTIEKTVTQANIHLVIENPDQYTITGVKFNYLNTSGERFNNFPSDGTTVIDVVATPERCYDSYTLTEIKYTDKDGTEKTYKKIVRIDLQFYKTLDKFEVWQSISKKYPENYRLTADIDFAGKSNINTEVLIGRLEGQTNDSGENYKLKNFTRTNVTKAKTGFIKMVTTVLKNVTFENFDISSTAGLSYINLIYLNYADIDNVQFNDITINTPKSSYVAPIGYHRGENLFNISINGNHITGTRNVAGLIAYMYNTSTADISASDCVITGTDTMIGGIVGEKPYRNGYNSYRYTATRMNVTGKTYVGGIFGQGGAWGATITDSTITGISGASLVGGISGYNNYENDRDHTVTRCHIIADGSNIGGIHGRALHFYNAFITDSEVKQTGTNRSYVGGAEGYQDGYTHSNYGVVNTSVTNAGDYTGGIEGRVNSGGSLTYTYTSKVTINGRNYVGGVTGYGNTARIYYNVTNVDLTATGNYVGGVIGYIASLHATDSAYSAVIYEILVVNSNIKGADNVGGFVGKTNNSQVTSTSFFTYVVIAANITSTGQNVGAVNGDDAVLYPNVQLTRFKFYQGTKINGTTLINKRPSNIAATYLASAQNLKTQSFYTGFRFDTARWDFNNIATYFPRVKNASSGSVDSHQLQIKIPTGDVAFARMNVLGAPIGHILPTMNAYSSGINKINLEFDKTDDYSYFEVYNGDTKILDKKIEDRTTTIYYDYLSDLKVVVTDGRNSKVYKYTKGELRNLTSTYDKNYAYIYKGKVLGNVSKMKSTGKFIHIYKNLALTDELEVFDITTGDLVTNSLEFTISLADKATPLFEFNYKDTKINTYYNYSVIEKEGQDIIYDKQMLVKNGAVEIIDSSLDAHHNMIILDNYSNNNYVSVLGTDGSIYDLKSAIKMPVNFSNKEILAMSNNVESKNNAVILIYKTGKVVVFDYRTGEEISVEKATENISIFEYFKQNLISNAPLIEDTKSSYKEAENLKELLTDNPIEESSSGDYKISDKNSDKNKDKIPSTTQSKKNYVTYYNAVRNNYDVIDVSNLLDSDDTTIDEDDIITENNKIYTSNALVEFYMKESLFTQVFKNVNGLYIFGAILVGIITALGLWIRNAKLLRNVEEVNNGKN